MRSSVPSEALHTLEAACLLEQVGGGCGYMRNLGVFTVLVLSGMTASCAQRVVPPATVASPSPAPETALKPSPKTIGEIQGAVVISEGAKGRLAARPRQVDASATTERRPEDRAPQSQDSQALRDPSHNLLSVAAPPPRPVPAESSVPAVVSLSPSPESTETAFTLAPHPVESEPEQVAIPEAPAPTVPSLPSAPPAMESVPAPEPVTPSVSTASPDAVMPSIPEPAEPSFPTATLMPLPAVPAEPPSSQQVDIAVATSVTIPFPELAEDLSLRPRPDWQDVTETFSLPHSLLPGTSGTESEKSLPSLIRYPWPLSLEL